MPTEQEITDREAVIQARLHDFCRAAPALTFNVDGTGLRGEAIRELTGMPPAPTPDPPVPDTHLDSRYVQIG